LRTGLHAWRSPDPARHRDEQLELSHRQTQRTTVGEHEPIAGLISRSPAYSVSALWGRPATFATVSRFALRQGCKVVIGPQKNVKALRSPRRRNILAPMSFLSRSADPVLMSLVEEAGRNVQRSGLLLRDLLVDYPEHATLASDLKVCEQEGDRITHDIIHRLAAGRVRAPFSAGDGYSLATALDDIVDHAEQAAAQLGLYGVEAPMEQSVEFADVLVGAGEQIAQALRALRTGTELGPHLVEIHRLENEGDRLQRDGVASLFAGGIDPMVVIRWKDIFESLEAAVDACETVAHVLEGITLKQRHGRG
jgi:uncharacterized protein